MKRNQSYIWPGPIWLLSICILSISYGQAPDTQWVRTYVGTIHQIQQQDDSGYVLSAPTGSGVRLTRIDALGNTMWTNVYSIGGTAAGGHVHFVKTLDNGYLIASANWGVNILKVDSLGDSLWTKHYVDASCLIGGMTVTSSGEYIIVGSITRGSSSEIYILKVDSLGDTLWTRTYGNQTDPDCAYGVVETFAGDYLIVGKQFSFGNWPGGFVMRLDTAGNIISNDFYAQGGCLYSIATTADHGYVVSGYDVVQPVGHTNVFLLKLDSLFTDDWSVSYGGYYMDVCHDAVQATDGGYIMTGRTDSLTAGNGDDIYILKTDSLGTLSWTIIFSGQEAEWGWSVQKTFDGGYVVAGETSFPNGIVVKLNSEAGIVEFYDFRGRIFDPIVYPNPCNGVISVRLTPPDNADVHIELLDVGGRRMDEVICGQLLKNHSCTVDYDFVSRNKRLAGGVYFIRFTSGENTITKPCVYIR